ncbi:hypothetical protein Raf01_19810 [Rugosimonospora africana]|uniref:DUF4352 domain-containing protein n=2 Tax=Rugosimonospora africana TaxID=556532 RepID=A0A8J3VP51_9ACTN|nr:hypothetical protein Raf01_19810 [Rugosimonospora africana]
MPATAAAVTVGTAAWPAGPGNPDQQAPWPAPGQAPPVDTATPPDRQDDEHRPIRSHRRRQVHRPIVRRLGAAAAVIVALAVGEVITDHVPDTDTQQKPFIHTGSIGKPVDVRTFDASVLSVRGAAVIEDPDPNIAASPTHDTSGVWVLVRIRLVAANEPVAVTYAAVQDAEGRTYLASTRFHQPFVDGGRMLQPGVPVAGEVAFEVPVAVVPQLSIRLASPGLFDDFRMDAMADIPLGISTGTAQQWKATTTAATVAPPEVVQ